MKRCPCDTCDTHYVGCKFACLPYRVYIGEPSAIASQKEIRNARRRELRIMKSAEEHIRKHQDELDRISVTEAQLKERKRERHRKYREEHREEARAKARARYAEEREKVLSGAYRDQDL